IGAVIINSSSLIGKNCNLSAGVTIGQTNRGDKKGSPTIGDRVWFGPNAVVVGGVTIGEDVLIAPGTFVNFDVPAHSIVIGNPGKIIPAAEATAGYIENILA
ncbi:MAG: DapH/DapD/GlmU-related protein, partial [Fibrobacteria bacterium]